MTKKYILILIASLWFLWLMFSVALPEERAFDMVMSGIIGLVILFNAKD